MDADILSKLEKTPYPASTITTDGENLRVFTKNETAFVPPVRTPALSHRQSFAICIPTNRYVLKKRRNFKRIMQLASDSENTLLLFMCSGQAKKEHIALLASDFPNLKWIAVDGSFSQVSPLFTTNNSPLSHGTERDLAQKRNFALRLAKLMGWESIFLLDDDIAITARQLQKTRALLAEKNVSIVGFNARSFPDNSVAVHVHRWIHGSVDSFLGGGALAIKTNTPFVSFFPRIYNEDWIFMLMYRLIGQGDIVWADSVQQRPYNPYKLVTRAISEEAGDIIGESLAKLIHVLDSTEKRFRTIRQLTTALRRYANEDFWNMEINNRLDYLHRLNEGLQKKRFHPYRTYQIKRSLKHSVERTLGMDGHAAITGERLAAWINAWCEDIEQWNAALVSEPEHETLAGALSSLSISSKNVLIAPAGYQLVSTAMLPTKIKPTPPKELRYDGPTSRQRSPAILENLALAKAVEEYLQDKALSIKKTASSADALRFDRPTHWITAIKPDFTVSMMVACGEPTAAIYKSVLDIISWSKNAGPLQLLVWVYSDSNHVSFTQLEMYRNRLIAQLLNSIQGTHIQVRSSILTDTSHIQDVINQSLDIISFAYWKQQIKAKHSIYVVNSRNELLRLGSFCQFMHREQVLPRYSLKYYLNKHAASHSHPSDIPKEHDIVALEISRRRLTQTPRQSHTSTKATETMLRHMNRARLAWTQLDELAYSITYHHITGEDSLEHPKKIICVPIEFRQTPTRDLSFLLSQPPDDNTAYFIVIYGESTDTWNELDAYHNEVLGHITAQYPNVILFSTSYRLVPKETARQFRFRIKAIASYAHWLQNHDTIPVIKVVK